MGTGGIRMRDVLRLSLPLTLWLITFSAVYGLHGLICAGNWGALPGLGSLTLGRTVFLAAAAAAILTQGAMIFLLFGSRFGGASAFLRQTGLALAVIALVATVWTVIPITLLPTCGS
jgi:hypothetical protein